MRLGYGLCTRDNQVLDDCDGQGLVLVPRQAKPVTKANLADFKSKARELIALLTDQPLIKTASVQNTEGSSAQ